MNQNNSHQIFIIDVGAGLSQPANGSQEDSPAGNFQRRTKKNRQQPVVDVIVVLVSLPALTILSLLLEANTRGNWLSATETRFTVFGLAIALGVVCLAICMYVTSRIGGKMWSGAIPMEADGNGPHYSYYNSRLTINDLNDKPPAYDVVMGFDIPPPPYTSIIFEEAIKEVCEFESCSKLNAIQHI